MGPKTPYELKLCQADLSQAYVWNPISKTHITCRREDTTSLSDVGTSIGSTIGFQYEKLKYEFLTGPVEGAAFYLVLVFVAAVCGWKFLRDVTR